MKHMEMIAAGILDAGLILFMVLSLVQRTRREKADERLYGLKKKEKEKGIWAWITPGGEALERWLSKLDRKQDSGDEVRQLLRDLSGKEIGELQYLQYRAKRWGSMILSLILVLSLFLIIHGMAESKDRTLDPIIQRPAYGEGDDKARVQMVLLGEEGETVREFSLNIPEKQITEEQALLALSKAGERLHSAYDGAVIASDVPFPPMIATEEGNVSVSYRSLDPKKMRSGGTLLITPGEKREPIRIEITCSLEGYTESQVVTLQLASEDEMGNSVKTDHLVEKIRKGQFTNEENIELPLVTEEGESISWRYAGEENSFLWAVLFVLIPALVIAKQDSDYKEYSARRLSEIKSAYPEFIGELVILMGAGLSLSSAWQRLGRDYRQGRGDRSTKVSMLMEEVSRTALEMEEGISIRDALDRFADRIPVKEVRRFVSLLTQNLRRGDAYVLTRLKELADDAWETRKKQAREKSEEVDTKLMLPLMMLLVVILIMVLSPALISMKF